MISKIFVSLLIGAIVGGLAYVVLGMLRRSGPGGSSESRGAAGKPVTQVKKKRPTDKDDDNFGGKGPDSGLAPTKEWVGGNRG